MNDERGAGNAERRPTRRSENRISKPQLAFLGALLLAVPIVILAAWLFLPKPGTANIPSINLDSLRPAARKLISAEIAAATTSSEPAAAWGRVGMLLAATGSHAQARDCFRHAHSLDPREFLWPYLLGVSLSAADPPAAVQPLRDAIALNDAAIAHIRLGELLLELNELERCEQHLTLALDKSPDDLHALFALAQLHLARGNVKESVAPAKRAVELNPRVRKTRELLAQVYHRLGDTTAAKRELTAAEALPDTPLRYDDPYVAAINSL